MIKNRLRRYVLLAAGLFLSAILVYVFCFRRNIVSTDTSLWGSFGSYIGGTAGALLSFVSILLLYETLIYQVGSNISTQFINGFFELFKLQKEITNRIEGDVTVYTGLGSSLTEHSTGEEYFEGLAREFDKKFDAYHGNIAELYMSIEDYVNRSAATRQSALQDINREYDKLFEGRESDLGHYFRSLFHLIKYVHKSEIPEKRKYVDLVQAYLTDSELYLIFYNGIGRYGKDKFGPLLDEYSFFENIKTRGPIFEYHFQQFYPKTYSNFIKKPKPLL